MKRREFLAAAAVLAAASRGWPQNTSPAGRIKQATLAATGLAPHSFFLIGNAAISVSVCEIKKSW